MYAAHGENEGWARPASAHTVLKEQEQALAVKITSREEIEFSHFQLSMFFFANFHAFIPVFQLFFFVVAFFSLYFFHFHYYVH